MRVAHLSLRAAGWLACGWLLAASGPAAPAPLVAAVLGSVVAEVVAGAIGGAVLFGTFTVGKLIGTIAGFAVSSLFSSVAGDESQSTQDTGSGFAREAQGRQEVIRSNVSPRVAVYGEVRKAGTLVFAQTEGANNANLDLVLVLAPHPVQAIGDIYFNDELVGELAADGSVTTGRFAGRAWITKYTGTQTAADPGLMARHPSKWTSAHVGYGCAYLVVHLSYSREGFPQGIPAVKAVVQGKKVYDPRDGQTRYSTNWALCVRDYLATPMIEGGLGAVDDEIDDTVVVESANVCDERVAVAGYEATCATGDLAPPARAPTVSATGTGTARYRWGVTFVSATGESMIGPLTDAANFDAMDGSAAVALTEIPLSADSTVTSRRLYRTTDGGSAPLLVATIADNTTTVYTDTALDSSLGAAPPTLATFRNRLTFAEVQGRFGRGDGVTIATAGTLPAPLLPATTYYFIPKDGDGEHFQLASSAANALAGVPIALTTAGSGSFTLTHVDQARYTMNGTVDTSRAPIDVLKSLMTAAAGTLTYPQGQFAPWAAAWAEPVLTIDEDALRGPIDMLAAPPRRQLFNAVKGTFADPSKDWQPSDFPPVRNATYAAQDGGEEVFKDVELPFVTDTIRAQRLAKIHLEKSRQGITVQMPCNLTVFSLAMWDTVSVDNSAFGWDAKAFRVVGWRLADDGGGVDLTLREDTSESYDWDAGDATVSDPAPDTNLPSAFDVAAPGTPTVSETLYETTGSAGVKVRADVSWAASTHPFVARYEAQYKADNDPETAWIALASVSLLQAQAPDLAPGGYDFRVRAINNLGVRSPWSDTRTVEIAGLTATPADVTGFSVVASAGFALASWTLTGDLDVRIGGAVVVRHSPLTSGATWENGVILKEFAGAQTTGLVPLVTGTYMAKFRDSTDHYSDTAATFVATEGMVTGLSTVTTITESTGFAGTKTNVVVSSLTLKLDSTTTIDSLADFDAVTELDSLGTVSPTGTYEFNTKFDGTTVAVRRFEADIAVTSSDTGDLVDARGEVDSWDTVDGSAVNDCNVTLYAAITNDDPASGGATWSAWTPFHVADFNCRGAKFKLEYESGSPNHNIAVSTLAVAVKA